MPCHYRQKWYDDAVCLLKIQSTTPQFKQKLDACGATGNLQREIAVGLLTFFTLKIQIRLGIPFYEDC